MKFRIFYECTVDAPEDDEEQVYQAFLEAFTEKTPADFDVKFSYRMDSRDRLEQKKRLRDILSQEEIDDINGSQT